MTYLVLARKYRPQRFGEMAGQEHVVRTIANAIVRGQLAHAFLFTGPRGVGKTTAARLVAKAVNCAQGPTAEPCGVCPACVEIAEGRAVDVVEIDAASNNGVDNVRDIVEAVKYRPARDRFKVFVIDEVHMLSTGAFNALLKTLEEPPPHVMFVLATTDVHKVPETIVSRCQRFDFRRLTQQQIVDQLGKVAAAERLALSPSALALVARSAEGGMRDALSLLDQVRAAGGDAPADEVVAEALGAIDPAAVSRIAAALVGRDGAAVLTEIEALHERGQEMKRVAEELVRHLRNVTVAKLVPAATLDLPDMERREVLAQAEVAAASQLARLFDLAQAAVTEVKGAEQPRYALEVALLKACFLAPGEDIGGVVARLEQLAGGAVAAAPAPRPGPAKAAAAPAPSPRPAATSSTTRTATMAPGAAPLPADPAERWRALVAAVDAQSPTLGGALKQAVLVSFGEAEIAVRVPPGLHARTLQTKKAEVEAAFARELGRPVRLASAVGEVAADAPVAAPSVAQSERAEREARSREVQAAARSHPKIQEAAQILGGEIDRTDEL